MHACFIVCLLSADMLLMASKLYKRIFFLSTFKTFTDLPLSNATLRAVNDLGFTELTPIQAQILPHTLANQDAIGQAQTGTGKTATFLLTIMEALLKRPFAADEKRYLGEPRAVVMAPTRELAQQIFDDCIALTKYTSLHSVCIMGGTNYETQQHELERQYVDILIATPGRLIDLMHKGMVYLDRVEVLVLDEADRMLDMGFIHDIKKIIPLLPKVRQTLFFSATMPASIAELSKSILNKPVRVEVTPQTRAAETVDQHLYFVEKPQKSDLLVNLLQQKKSSSVLVFLRTKHGADKIARILNKKGIECEAIHGNKTQNARQRALTNFKSGKTNVIIATDIAARGIDISNLELVINYDMPDVAETYIHRIGRTGRAGQSGTALTFCSADEKLMVRDIQKLTGKKINELLIPA